MAKDTPRFDTSTICDLTLKAWLDQYPGEKTAALQDKYLTLNRYLRDAAEKHTKLSLAKEKLKDLTRELEPALPIILSAAAKRTEFQQHYDEHTVSPQTSYESIEKMVRKCYDDISLYATNVEAEYFKNLNAVEASIAYITALRDFYQTLFNAVVKIRDGYFKTQQDRRKPVIRDLYRDFSALAENKVICGTPTTIEDPPHTHRIDNAEYDSLVAVRREAGKTAAVLKKAR